MAANAKIHPKQELIDHDFIVKARHESPNDVILLSSSDSDSDSDSDNFSCNDEGLTSNNGNHARKKRKTAPEDAEALLPLGFLDPLPSKQTDLLLPLPPPPPNELEGAGSSSDRGKATVGPSAKQFWKAGDFDEAHGGDWDSTNGGMDHVRVHPKFLHSNATSHKWVLGAFAELLDNSLDEVCYGATYVNVDMVKSKKDGNKMLLIEDDGGGMDVDKIRHCMSLGYSAKSKLADTIGQYGNGFKTSTMRLGADVIVFTRCPGSDGKRSTQSIGLLSYTFLKCTGKEDIIVPMLDYERNGQDWDRIVRSSVSDWNRNVETIVQWSPFSSEADLLHQFDEMQSQGTRIFIYNLWEDDQGLLELDFDSDPHDIQIRGVNRDEKNIEMGKKYPNSKHFLTYRHSLRSYAAIIYLRIPSSFRIILRGLDVEHHNIVNDMMMSQEITYRPQTGVDGIPKDANMVAVVTVGFVKDASHHIDVQGFNVYHKNRLIKPFWRIWHPPGSDGRGVIGVLEANFVEPAHDKQDFERTTVLARLETRLVQVQKTYWTSNCHKIGYSYRGGNRKSLASNYKGPSKPVDKSYNNTVHFDGKRDAYNTRQSLDGKGDAYHTRQSPVMVEENTDEDREAGVSGNPSTPVERPPRTTKNSAFQDFQQIFSNRDDSSPTPASAPAPTPTPTPTPSACVTTLKEENNRLRERLKKKEAEILGDLLHDLEKEKEKCKLLEEQLQDVTRKHEELQKEHEYLIDVISEERLSHSNVEKHLRKKLEEASVTMEQLLNSGNLASSGK